MTFLTAEWRKLAIANYAIDPEVLRPFLPAHTTLDLHNGKCLVSLVGFMFLKTKLKGIPIPFHINFEEVNLRFYVSYLTKENEKRRGVVFISEIVPKPALSIVANVIYGEHYETRLMKHNWIISDKEIEVDYSWKKNKWHNFKIIADANSVEMHKGSDEEFITEHYWGYSTIDSHSTNQYAVDHPRWKVYPVKKYSIDVDFELSYGKTFAFLNQQNPDSVMLAEGSEISVMPGAKITE